MIAAALALIFIGFMIGFMTAIVIEHKDRLNETTANFNRLREKDKE